ncbi:MAG: hypothetical protein MRJ65_02970 [Candidatus Brocadiaceae bacterium]|nr:hypothetical protein [Candidatus Brocadiaceae bacterium]
MNTSIVTLFLVVFSMAIVLTGMPDQSEAESKKFIGTYFTLGSEGDIETPVIVQIGKDGTYNTVFGIQGTGLVGGINFTDDVGTWKKTGSNEIAAVTVSVEYTPPTESSPGELVANCIADHVITFSNKVNDRFQDIDVMISGRCYEPDVNPADPDDAPVIVEFTGNFQGKRVNLP